MCHAVRFQISFNLKAIENTSLDGEYLPLAEKLEIGEDSPEDEIVLQD
jgi:hypothetical protein